MAGESCLILHLCHHFCLIVAPRVLQLWWLKLEALLMFSWQCILNLFTPNYENVKVIWGGDSHSWKVRFETEQVCFYLPILSYFVTYSINLNKALECSQKICLYWYIVYYYCLKKLWARMMKMHLYILFMFIQPSLFMYLFIYLYFLLLIKQLNHDANDLWIKPIKQVTAIKTKT